MKTLRPLIVASAAVLPLLSIPAFAQSNAAPPAGKGGESGGSGGGK